jgi:hypothetical protein
MLIILLLSCVSRAVTFTTVELITQIFTVFNRPLGHNCLCTHKINTLSFQYL